MSLLQGRRTVRRDVFGERQRLLEQPALFHNPARQQLRSRGVITGPKRSVWHGQGSDQHLEWPRCPPRMASMRDNRQQPLSTNGRAEEAGIRSSCIAIGDPRLTDETNYDYNDSLRGQSPSKVLDWPFPAESSVETTSTMEGACSETFVSGSSDRNTPIKSSRVPSCKTRGHVKQAASCGTPVTFASSFQFPRPAPCIRPIYADGNMVSAESDTLTDRSRPSWNHEAAGKVSQGHVAPTANSNSIKRFHSLNESGRERKREHLPSTARPRRPSLRASLNKALPQPMPNAEDAEQCLTTRKESSCEYCLPVLELDNFLHDLTLANRLEI